MEAASKPRLRPERCVVPRIEMLTYFRVRSAFNPRDALLSGLIRGFEATLRLFIFVEYSVDFAGRGIKRRPGAFHAE